MRTWARAEREIKCGYCRRRWIARGEPVLKIHLPTMRRDLYRCVDCAGETPPELPSLVEKSIPQLASFETVQAEHRWHREWMPYKEPN